MVSPAAKNSLGLYYAAKPLSQLEFGFTDKSSTTVKEEKERNYYGEKKVYWQKHPFGVNQQMIQMNVEDAQKTCAVNWSDIQKIYTLNIQSTVVTFPLVK